MKRILSYGMAGGGKGSLIGPAHREAIGLDGRPAAFQEMQTITDRRVQSGV